MTDRATCKLGLVLPGDFHRRMLAGATTSLSMSPALGAVRRACGQTLDAGEEAAFAADRGAKAKVTVSLPEALCRRTRRRREDLHLKLTDLTRAAVTRALSRTGD